MRRWLRLPIAFGLVLPAIILIVANVRLFFGAGSGSDAVQLRSLDSALNRDAAADMQVLFPEGFVFTHALRGLACVAAVEKTSDPATRAPLIEQARASLAALESDQAAGPFAGVDDPPSGIFLNAWRARLRAGLIAVAPEGPVRDADANVLRQECNRIAAALRESRSPFLCSYPSQSWPADSVVAAAALRAAERVFDDRPYAKATDDWITRAKQLTDPATGLLPHRTDPTTGATLAGPRGPSKSLMNVFLPEIDPVWAAEHYRAFRSRFVDSVLGVTGVREHPIGVSGRGDVDSGPLIFGLSTSASVVAIGAVRANGDVALAEALSHGAEMGGFPYSIGGRKRYALGLLPVGDALLVWARTRPREGNTMPGTWPPIARPWRFTRSRWAPPSASGSSVSASPGDESNCCVDGRTNSPESSCRRSRT